MLNILLAVQITIAVALIVLVLMQRSEGGGLGIGGGGNSKSASLGKLDGMQRLTWLMGALFFVSCIVLTIVAGREQGNTSILDQLDGISASDVINESQEDEDATEAPADPNAPLIPADPNS